VEGATTMGQYATNRKTLSDAVSGGGLLVVAQWEAKEGQADKVAEILHRFLPEAQNDPGSKLFLISRGKENPAQFLFYELFADEAALKAHQESAYFKNLYRGSGAAAAFQTRTRAVRAAVSGSDQIHGKAREPGRRVLPGLPRLPRYVATC